MSYRLYSGINRFLERSIVDPATTPAPVDSPNPLNICLSGFTTDPTGAADGQRTQATQFQDLYPGSDFAIWAWDQDGWGYGAAIAECQGLIALIRAGNARGAYSHVLTSGHSFGGCFLEFFLNWLPVNAPDVVINLARFLDPVPNVFDTGPWIVPLGPTTVQRAMQWTQHNGLGWWFLLGPNGTPLISSAPPLEIESVDFPFGTANMNHVLLPADDRVWTPSLKAMIEAVTG